MSYRIVIGGCRTFDNYKIFEEAVDSYLNHISPQGDIVILSGHCRGTDMLAEKYAKIRNYKLEIIPAQWKLYGKSAGPIRNRIMVESSNCVIAFWDNKSRGTKNLVYLANQFNKPLFIKYI